MPTAAYPSVLDTGSSIIKTMDTYYLLTYAHRDSKNENER